MVLEWFQKTNLEEDYLSIKPILQSYQMGLSKDGSFSLPGEDQF
jgi:hypothetical protein